TLLTGYVHTLVAVASPGAHPFARRQLRAALVGLTNPATALDDAQRSAIAAAARSWSAWFATEKTSDWLGPADTAVFFARIARSEVPEAVRRFDDLVRAGDHYMLGIEGWEELLGEARAIEIARAAVADHRDGDLLPEPQ